MTIVDPTTFADWNDSVGVLPGSSLFHTSNWAAVLCRTYSYKPVYFADFKGGRLSALIPVMEIDSPFSGKRGVSLPFADYCSPLFEDKNTAFSLFEDLLEYGRGSKWKYIEVRGWPGHREPEMLPYSTYLRHVLPLHEDEARLFENFKPSTRRNIKKAIAEGVEVIISDSREDMDQYYRLHCLTRKRQGVPPQPFSFFLSVHTNIISQGAGFIALGRHKGIIVAGAVYFNCGRKAMYKYGASDFRYQDLRANNLVMWEAIRWFAGNGYEEFCFGRTDSGNHGLIRFKEGWGARKEVLHYQRYDFRHSCFMQGKARMGHSFNKFLSCVPVPFLRLAGTILYKHVG